MLLPLALLPAETKTDQLRTALLEFFRVADDSAALESAALGVLSVLWTCGAVLDGRMAPLDLCRWAYRYSRWEGPSVFEPFEVLDDEYGEVGCLPGRPRAEVDADVRVAATTYLQNSLRLVH